MLGLPAAKRGAIRETVSKNNPNGKIVFVFCCLSLRAAKGENVSGFCGLTQSSQRGKMCRNFVDSQSSHRLEKGGILVDSALASFWLLLWRLKMKFHFHHRRLCFASFQLAVHTSSRQPHRRPHQGKNLETLSKKEWEGRGSG